MLRSNNASEQKIGLKSNYQNFRAKFAILNKTIKAF